MIKSSFVFLLGCGIIGCQTSPEGLRQTPDGNGPRVLVDWDAEPFPDIPFPNNMATKPDSDSPTGRRLNISTEASTVYESETREKLNTLTGFGIFAPITVAFEAPLDLAIIAERHRDDEKLGDNQFSDDAFFVINVDPDSPDYLKPVSLEIGQGRYPLDVPRSDRFFPNDSRSESPTVIFDTVDEDLNGNGVLDWGEDSDNDGILDVPNLYPIDGDPVDDLLAWYERSSNTLIMRPVLPLYEETTYAVVLTERLKGENGEPVLSPWEFVHHLDQNQELQPLPEAMEQLGMSTDDIAFAWTFSTGRITGDLVDVRRGLYGDGPFKKLATEYPAGVTHAHETHDIEGVNPYLLPLSHLGGTLSNLGLLDGEGGQVAADSFARYGSDLVGGSFITPYFLVDTEDDEDGFDDSDEYWRMNSKLGTYTAGPQRVPFTCTLPNENTGALPPYDVVFFGHGYGSSRFDGITFAWSFNQLGYAVCFNDFPGHGPTISQDDLELYEPVLDANNLLPFLHHLEDSRYRDLNNDGVPDSGGDQWSADVFHTRDMVRQAVVDWIQFVNSLKMCGEGTMLLDDGSEQMTCDWNNDGAIDLGGEDAKYYILGGSLGGINAAVAAAVMPEVEAFSPIAGGASLFDMALRTEISGAVEAMHGRILAPMFMGYPNEDGSLRLIQMVNSERDMIELEIDTIPEIPVLGRVVVENLTNGEVREGMIPADGRFRIGLPADGLSPAEKKVLVGMPDSGPSLGTVYEVANNKGLGDLLKITIYTEQGALLHTIDSWANDTIHEGITMKAGSPLVAGSHGTGRIRGSSNVRRIASIFGSVLEAGDPVAYAPHYFLRPFEDLGGEQANVLMVPSIGDTIVPVSSGITMARVAGVIPQDEIDERYEMTVDQWLVDKRVIQGVEQYGDYVDVNGSACLFDADDLDNGLDGTGAPSEDPLRLSYETDVGISGLRLPYTSTTGSHGFGMPKPSAIGDQNSFALNQIVYYFYTGGQEISDDPCMSSFSCDWIPELDINTAEEDDNSDSSDTGGDR
jgi:hypothetical protein